MLRTAMEDENKPFSHFSLNHKVIAWISSRLFDDFVYTVRHGLLTGMKRKGGLGWLPSSLSESVDSPEQAFWRGLPLQGKTVYDIGAFHGLLTLHFARRASRVVSYEPTPASNARLRVNLQLNGLQNVVIRDVALGAKKANATITYSPLVPGAARIGGVGEQTASIAVTTLDQDIQERSLPVPDLVKIDTEGMELEVLQGARNTLLDRKPALFLEMHGETMAEKKRNTAAVVAYLNEAGYHDIRHIESGEAIAVPNAHAAARGHLYAV